jgi:hypothetical protein
MSCVYTGARILIVEYGFIAPADLYLVGEAIIARWNGRGKQWVDTLEQMEDATHRIFCNPSCWMRDDLSTIVVPRDQCEGELRIATVHDYTEYAAD